MPQPMPQRVYAVFLKVFLFRPSKNHLSTFGVLSPLCFFFFLRVFLFLHYDKALVATVRADMLPRSEPKIRATSQLQSWAPAAWAILRRISSVFQILNYIAQVSKCAHVFLPRKAIEFQCFLAGTPIAVQETCVLCLVGRPAA